MILPLNHLYISVLSRSYLSWETLDVLPRLSLMIIAAPGEPRSAHSSDFYSVLLACPALWTSTVDTLTLPLSYDFIRFVSCVE
jgi:hypothetical protein